MQIPPISGSTAAGISPVVDTLPRQSAPTQPGRSDLQSLNVSANAVQGSEKAVSQQSVEDAVKKLNDTVKLFSNSNSLQFSVDQDTGIELVKVVDTSTKEVIKQFPSEEAVALAKAIDQFKGMLVKEKA